MPPNDLGKIGLTTGFENSEQDRLNNLTIYEGDPNGNVTSAKGVLCIDTVTPAIWQNSNAATAWTKMISGSVTFSAVDGIEIVKVCPAANFDISAGGLTVDGITVVVGQLALLQNQTTTTENGLYVASVGSWSRAPGYTAAIPYKLMVFVTSGDSNSLSLWINSTPDPSTVGTTVFTFLRIAGGGVVDARNGLNFTSGYVEMGGLFIKHTVLGSITGSRDYNLTIAGLVSIVLTNLTTFRLVADNFYLEGGTVASIKGTDIRLHSPKITGTTALANMVWTLIDPSNGKGEWMSSSAGAGTIWHSGTSAPTSVVDPAVGDYYLRSTTGDYFKYISSGSGWVLQGNLLGPVGPIGS